MRIVFTHNLQLSSHEEEAEFDRPETVAAITEGLRKAGHEVEPLDVSGPASRLVARLEALNPDMVFNTAEGSRGRFREGFYPALFDQLGIPYTGSDAYVCTATLDKQFTKLVLDSHGVPTPQWRFVDDVRQLENHELKFPVIVKPNFEGSSMGITVDSVVADDDALMARTSALLARFPSGVLVEEFIVGRDLVVPFIEASSPKTGGILEPAVYNYKEQFAKQRTYQIYDYEMKSQGFDAVTVRVPADIPADARKRVMEVSAKVIRVLGIRDVGRIDYRITEDGDIYFLEVNALPSLEEGASLYLCGALAGLETVDKVLHAIVRSAADRQGLEISKLKQRRRKAGLRTGLIYKPSGGANSPPGAVDAVRRAIESYGHTVVELEASPELPTLLPASALDLAFNMARGVRGRRGEVHVPALLELLDIEFTGSGSTAMSFAFDKTLAKRLVGEMGCAVPAAQFISSPNDKLRPDLKFPVIVKPLAARPELEEDPEIVHNESELRDSIAEIVSFRRQVLVAESYVEGREFVLGLLGERRPRVLPAMEVLFDGSDEHPFRSAARADSVRYKAPPDLEPGAARALRRVAKTAFTGLGCRDIATVLLRLTPEGKVYFLTCSPMPYLTPGQSDMFRVAEAAGLDFRSLIGEIMSPALRRLKHARRERILASRV